MAPYSLDLRKRVLRAWDSGMDVYSVATRYEASRAWVHRLVQRRRETGSIEPAANEVSGPRAVAAGGCAPSALITAQPDATLAELCDALPTTAALSTLWRRIGELGFTLKKNGTRRRTAPA